MPLVANQRSLRVTASLSLSLFPLRITRNSWNERKMSKMLHGSSALEKGSCTTVRLKNILRHAPANNYVSRLPRKRGGKRPQRPLVKAAPENYCRSSGAGKESSSFGLPKTDRL